MCGHRSGALHLTGGRGRYLLVGLDGLVVGLLSSSDGLGRLGNLGGSGRLGDLGTGDRRLDRQVGDELQKKIVYSLHEQWSM